MNNNPFILIVGTRGCGKTILVKDILNHWGVINNCIVFTHFAEKYENTIDKQFIHTQYSDNIIKNIKDMQKVQFIKEKQCDEFYIVFDDFQNIDYMTNIKFRELALNHKCFNISIIFVTQYMNGLMSPELRSQIDHVFLSCSELNRSSHYFSQIPIDLDLVASTRTKLAPHHFGFYVYSTYIIQNNLSIYFDKNVTNAATTIQKHWRRVLAQRQLQRLKIKQELELLPGIGIEYQRAFERFRKNNY